MMLSEWREQEARRNNLARPFVVRDETLLELARRRPGVRPICRKSCRCRRASVVATAASLIDAVDRASSVPERDLPRQAPRAPRVERAQRAGAAAAGAGRRPRARAGSRARECWRTSGCSSAWCATSPARLARAAPELEGWRREVVGLPALSYLDAALIGELAAGAMLAHSERLRPMGAVAPWRGRSGSRKVRGVSLACQRWTQPSEPNRRAVHGRGGRHLTTAIESLRSDIEEQSRILDRVRLEVAKLVVGQREMIDRLLLALIADGHLLVEGIPGLAKTTAIKALAAAVEAGFARIQFTPDLLPADLIGTQIYRPGERRFEIKQGPVFTNLLLADEINRAPAKVQSALLEAMQERQVTIGEETRLLPDPFLVLATQNPIEQEGTYPLPEAQVDRFMLKIKVSYPKREEEVEIMRRMAAGTGQCSRR
jgi:hypothetical protein